MPPFFDDCAATLPLFLLPPITPLSVILYDIGFKLQLINCACVFLSVTTYSYKLATTAPDWNIRTEYICFFLTGRRRRITIFTFFVFCFPPSVKTIPHHSSRAAYPKLFPIIINIICLFVFFFFFLFGSCSYLPSIFSLSLSLVIINPFVKTACVCFVCAATSPPSSCECDLLALIFKQWGNSKKKDSNRPKSLLIIFCFFFFFSAQPNYNNVICRFRSISYSRFFFSSHISIRLFLHHPKVLIFFFSANFFFQWQLVHLKAAAAVVYVCVCEFPQLWYADPLRSPPNLSSYLNWIFFSLYNDRLIDKEILLSFALEKTQQNKKETAIFFHTLIVYRYTYITKAIYILSFHFEMERRH